MGSVEGAWERAASQCILRISVRKRASSRAKDSAGSAEGVESLESLVESVASQILFETLPGGNFPKIKTAGEAPQP